MSTSRRLVKSTLATALKKTYKGPIFNDPVIAFSDNRQINYIRRYQKCQRTLTKGESMVYPLRGRTEKQFLITHRGGGGDDGGTHRFRELSAGLVGL